MSDFYDDNLLNTTWYGEVVDNEDPTFNGRVRVRVFGKFDELEIEAIPWAISGNNNSPSNNTGGSSHNIPKLGSHLKIEFENGNLYTPIYKSYVNLSDDVINEIQSSYKNSHVWCYDTETEPGPLKVFFTEEKGYFIDFNESTININKDGDLILTRNDDGKIVHIKKDHISLGKLDESDEPAVLGLKNEIALTEITNQLGKLVSDLKIFAEVQEKITSSVSYLAPLKPGYKQIIPKLNKIKQYLDSPIKDKYIPETKSISVSVDGPSKI